MYQKISVLIIEDEKSICDFIGKTLDSHEYKVTVANNGKDGLALITSSLPDLVLLDLGLPDMDGEEILKKVREWSEMPIIIVSARDQDKEKAALLDLGADDYLTKPFSATELMARIRVALRHLYRQGLPRPQSVYRVGGLELDVEKHAAVLDGEPLHLTPMEFSLMSLLIKNAGKVLTSGYILKEVWGAAYDSDTQALRALMAALRRKVEKNPAKPRYIFTEIGIGYRMADE